MVFDNDDTPEDAPLPAEPPQPRIAAERSSSATRPPSSSTSSASTSSQSLRPALQVTPRPLGRSGTPGPDRSQTPLPRTVTPTSSTNSSRAQPRAGLSILSASSVAPSMPSAVSLDPPMEPSIPQRRPAVSLDPPMPKPERFAGPLDPSLPKPGRANTPMPSRSQPSHTAEPIAESTRSGAWRGPVAIIGILAIVVGMGGWAWRRNQQANVASAEELRTLLAPAAALPVGIDAYVTGLGQRLLPLATIADIRFGTRLEATPRLVVVPGVVIVSTGVLQRLRNEGQLAAVLALGITHLEHQLVEPALQTWRTDHDGPMDESSWLSVGQSAAPEAMAVAMDRRAVTLVRAAGYPALAVPQMWAQLSHSPIAEAHPGPLDRLPMQVAMQAGGDHGEAAYVAAVFGPLKRAETESDRVVVEAPKPARDPFPVLEGTPAQQVALMDQRCGGYTCTADLKATFKSATKGTRWSSDAADCYRLCKADYDREGGSEPGRDVPPAVPPGD